MTTIQEQAKAYEPKKTKNIAELDKVDVNTEIVEKTYNKEDGEEFIVNVITIDDEDYRVPTQVIQQVKGLIEKFPDTKYFSVSKSGEGLKTQYQVFPVSE